MSQSCWYASVSSLCVFAEYMNCDPGDRIEKLELVMSDCIVSLRHVDWLLMS